MILLLDHDDSFVHTLARYVAELGGDPLVLRARYTTAIEVAAMRASHLILSPGPGTPAECGVALELVRTIGSSTPILGVCLGHQCIAAAYGARVARSAHPRHGRTSPISHDGLGVLSGIPEGFLATRYHSLAVSHESVPPELLVTATSNDGEVMGIRHRNDPVEGVQFHPESVLSEWGYRLLANFLGRTDVITTKDADSAHYPSADDH
jgi:anthranilate synthase component 2